MKLARPIVALGLIFVSTLFLSACTLPWQKELSGLQVQIPDGTTTQVYLNDLHLGQAPINNQDLKPGTYKLRLEPSGTTGKQAYETQIDLYSGSITSVLWSFTADNPSGTGDILELEPLPSATRAELSVITVPEGASVLLNSTTYGLSPVVLDDITPGEYSLTLNTVGHVKKTLPVQVQPGFRLHIYSRLEKEAAATAQPEETITDTTATSGAQLLSAPQGSLLSPSPSPTPKAGAAPSSPRTLPAKPYVTIKDTGTGWLRVRSEASSAGAEVSRVDVGASYPYKSTLNGWYEIEYETGKTGWISGQFGDIVR